MKKVIISLISLFFIFNLISCDKKDSQATVTTTDSTAYSIKESSTCNVSIEPKIELLSIVQYLADDPTIIKENLSSDNDKYSKDIASYFSKYIDDPVVTLYKKMLKTGFSYSTPPQAMLYVDDNLKLLTNLTLPSDVISAAGNKKTLIKFFDLLSDFRKKSSFDDFYLSHIDLYKKLVSTVKEKVDKLGCIDKLIDYYGYKQNSYNFIIEPLSIGGYAARIPSKNDKFDLYDFMVIPNDDAEFFQMVIHEFGHSYVNPLTEKNIDEVNKYSNLFTPIKDAMTKEQYGSWDFCVNEHIVRAVAYRNLDTNFSSGVNRRYIDMDTNRKFIYLDALSEKLKEYENNRNKYKTFNDFYPKLLETLKEFSDSSSTKK
ncbi:DUF4932 domain-containing protein [Clostridium paridis]|uniref:DUF4932 domain-containing protein n=1 Tax=Clostridium paridis TaxID=2803863 RepID=A0A937FHX9_9CLOT|nr:DUF4932 domain-containing protein [Clostridium paridis]MBL4933724.1 DUF4932 domain-containing protein [Clostridium paridis]